MSHTRHRAGNAAFLIAHADDAVRSHLRSLLETQDAEVQESATVRATLAALEAAPPDLLLLDPALADASRPPLLALLRDHPLRATMAILALVPTHLPDADLLVGADQILLAPFAALPLQLAVQALLRLKLAERSARELSAKRARDQQTLQQAGSQLAAARTLPDTLAALAHAVRSLLGYDRVSIALYDQRSATLRNALTTSTSGQLLPTDDLPPINLAPGSPLRDLPAYQALFDHALDLFFLPDSAGHAPPYFRPYLDGPVCESLLVALRTADQPVGLLTVDNLFSRTPFNPDDAALLVTLAGLAALAIERTRLATALDARVHEAETIARIGTVLAGTLDPATLYPRTLALLRSALPADFITLLIYRDGWLTVEAVDGAPNLRRGTPLLPIQGTDITWVPRGDSAPLIIRDTESFPAWRDIAPWTGTLQIRSVISIPLRTDTAVVGVLIVGAREPGAFDRNELRLVSTVVERIGLAIRTAQLYAAEQERAQAAEDLARMRNDFVASVSHELRTPLTAIVGFSEMLQARWNQIGERERLSWIDKIVNAAGRQQRLVEDLLLLTRVETGELTPKPRRISLRRLCLQAAEEVEGTYPGQRIDLVGPDHLDVFADPERTIQIVANLMDNAAKYSSEGSPIIVWWGAEGEKGVARVLDQGPGISEEGRAVLFKKFGRVSGSRMRSGRVGTGLGLFIGRGLARAMGGDVELESTGPEGSTFLLKLPLYSEMMPAQSAAQPAMRDNVGV